MRVTLAKILIGLFFFLNFFFSNSGFGQTYHIGTDCGGSSAYTYTNYVMTDRGAFWQKRILEDFSTSAGSRKWEFEDNVYFDTWRAPSTIPINVAGHNQVIPPNSSTASAYWRGAYGGGDGARLLATTTGNYYTFNISENGWANSYMGVLETNFSPKSFVSIVDEPGSYGSRIATVTLSAAPSTGENVYIRYTTDNYANSSLIPVIFTGNVGTATIPVPSSSSFPITQKYYAYSSPKTIAEINTEVILYSSQVAHDMLTLDLSAGVENVFSNPVVVTSSGGTTLMNTYPTVYDAFTAINAGTAHKGVITIALIGNTTETSGAVLNPGDVLPASYSSIGIQPAGGSPRTITGNATEQVIDLNGADNVTIDGREGGNGPSMLTIVNPSTSSAVGTSTIRFRESAENDTVRYCTIKGSSTATVGGICFFADAGTGAGNNSNFIEYNEITNNGGARPVNVVCSAETSGTGNSFNTISNNNIYDFFNQGIASNGVNIAANNTNWTISGNSFYETTTFASTADVEYNVIRINNTGTGFSVAGNYIGGSGPLCTGSSFNKSGSNNLFRGIYLNVGTGTVTVTGNTIKSISWSNTGKASWTAIHLESGEVDIGGIAPGAGNKIGESTSTGSITVTAGSFDAFVYGIYSASTNSVNIQHNELGSITAANSSSAYNTSFYGIVANSITANTLNISQNSIGSALQPQSIRANSLVTDGGKIQEIIGIYNLYSGTVTISENSICNLDNSSTNINSRIDGIWSEDGTNTIQGNLIHDLTNEGGTGASFEASIVGINIPFANASIYNHISGNEIYNLSNSNSTGSINISGIFYKSDGEGLVEKNFIHNLSSSSSNASIHGIDVSSVYGITQFQNNIISLTAPASGASLYGLKVFDGQISFYFNTVSITGTNSGPVDACLFVPNLNTGAIVNNIFANASNGVADNYSVKIQSNTGTVDYNDYIGDIGFGSPGVHSEIRPPLFPNASGTSLADYIPAADPLIGDSTFLPGLPAIIYDIDGTARCLPTMGAQENTTPAAIPVFLLGATSSRCQGAGVVTYKATAAFTRLIVYYLDATSLAEGNTIDAETGEVTYVATWSGTTVITAASFGCAGPKTASHTVTVQPKPNPGPIYHD